MKIKQLSDNIHAFYCPACGMLHSLVVGGNGWQFNGNYNKPTYKPSVLVTNPQGRRCHSYITDGKIQYLSDCKHDMAGQTVEMMHLSASERYSKEES